MASRSTPTADSDGTGGSVMPRLRLCVDRCSSLEICGWVDEDGPLHAIEIEVNDNWVCTLSPTIYRDDLEGAGLGDGRRAFSFSLIGRLKPGKNVIAIKRGAEILFKNSDVMLFTVDGPEAHTISQQRWRSDEPAAGLTWGSLMTGDSLWDIYQKMATFTGADRILEIGPGYGRILKTAIERKVPFSSYTAVELSEFRVSSLRDQFKIASVEFVQGDIDNWIGSAPFDVVLCSSTFEHLHPDCRCALKNIHRQLANGGRVFIDFIRSDSNTSGFEETGTGTYARTYSQEELRRVFRQCGYDVRAVETCTLGQDVHGKTVDRFVVVAAKA